MDTRDIYKLVRELSEDRDDVINLHDSVDIELSEDFVIETGVVGFMKDGVILHLDEDAMEMLDLNGMLLESEELAYENAAAIASMAAGMSGSHEDLDMEQFMDEFLDPFNDPYEMVEDALSGEYGEEIQIAIQKKYDDVVIDNHLHPDDDFEEIIQTIVDQLGADSEMNEGEPGYSHMAHDNQLAELKKLALGHEEVDEGLGKALIGGAALIAAMTGINKLQADHLMKTEPQLIALTQMHQEAVKKGDEYKIRELEDRIEKTLDHISATGHPVLGDDGRPVDPREPMGEAEYQGRKVPLNKPMQGDVKKSKVYVKKPNGKVVKVNFGDKNMRIKKSNPNRRKSFRARHNCDNPGPKWKARYWSCRAW